MTLTPDYSARLCAMLGLVPWRLRRDVARDAQENAAGKVPAVAQESAPPAAPVPQPPVIATGTTMPPEEDYARAQTVAQDMRVWAADYLTVIQMPHYGSWWLPALSLRDGEMRLFRSREEDDMLHAMLGAMHLHALADLLGRADDFFSKSSVPAKPLPPDAKELLSLPKPWVLCGAVARQQGEAQAGSYTPLYLHHPLLLLRHPGYKRSAWEQLIAYKQVIHV